MPKTLKNVNLTGRLLGWVLGAAVAAVGWFLGLVFFGAIFRGLFEVAYLGWTGFGYF